MDVMELELSDAEAIEDLANHHYPADYSIPLADICDNLTKKDKESFFLGLKNEKGQLLGYLIGWIDNTMVCLLYTSPSPRDRTRSRMPSSA